MKQNIILSPQSRRVIRCTHCGGAMRDYRDGVNCLLCGRTLEHSCERCKHPEYKIEAFEKQVA